MIYAGDGGTSAAPTLAYAYTGNTTIYGGLGTDVIQGNSGTDVLYAGDGGTSAAPTSVLGGSGVATIDGGAGDSLLQDLNSGQDLIVSATGDDTLLGTGNDTLVAGTGNDVLQTNGNNVTLELNAGFGNDSLQYTTGSPENVLFGTGIEATDLTGAVTFDSLGGAYLNFDGDGGSVLVNGGFVGGLGSVSFADTGTITTQTLLTDAFGGDSTVVSGSNSLVLNLANSESVAPTMTGGTLASWGNNVTITGGAAADRIYSAGSAALIAERVNGFETPLFISLTSNAMCWPVVRSPF